MRRVTGIGGVFFQARDPVALREWYRRHLGIELTPWGGASLAAPGPVLWSVSPAGEPPFAPGASPFVVNYRVDDLADLVAALRSEGCTLVGEPQTSEYGRFAWVLDGEGNRVELWQPPSEA